MKSHLACSRRAIVWPKLRLPLAHGIDHVGFAAAVGADHGHQLAGHVNGGGVGERFETGKFDVGERMSKSDGKRRRAILAQIAVASLVFVGR